VVKRNCDRWWQGKGAKYNEDTRNPSVATTTHLRAETERLLKLGLPSGTDVAALGQYKRRENSSFVTDVKIQWNITV